MKKFLLMLVLVAVLFSSTGCSNTFKSLSNVVGAVGEGIGTGITELSKGLQADGLSMGGEPTYYSAHDKTLLTQVNGYLPVLDKNGNIIGYSMK